MTLNCISLLTHEVESLVSISISYQWNKYLFTSFAHFPSIGLFIIFIHFYSFVGCFNIFEQNYCFFIDGSLWLFTHHSKYFCLKPYILISFLMQAKTIMTKTSYLEKKRNNVLRNCKHFSTCYLREKFSGNSTFQLKMKTWRLELLWLHCVV